MCGIAGLHDRPQTARSTIAAMLSSIAHRGPDDEGVWIDDENGVVLGHRRLSIIDVSPAGHQPMASASSRYMLTYNGEIYNYPELHARLEREGVAPSWRGHSDTEVLLAGFDAWGIVKTLQHCNGMFALAVWDRAERALTLARDRMGEKPLYFGWIDGSFGFASELKALSRMPGWVARMAPGAIASFVGTGYVHGAQSAVEGIYRLPAGCVLTMPLPDLGTPRDWDWLEARIDRYWSLREVAVAGVSSPLIDAPGTMAELEDLLSESIQLRMVADVPIGAFLSGGIDSSLVVALMQTQSTRPVRTFSIGFPDPTHDEAPHARAIARHLGTEHIEMYVGPNDALQLVPRLAETFDEPFADYSQIPTMLVSSLARRHVTVALTGDAGDELFAGYGRYFGILRLWRSLQLLPPGLRGSAAPALAYAAAATRHLPGSRDLPHRLARLAERLRARDADELSLTFLGGAGVTRLLVDQSQSASIDVLPPPDVRETLQRLMYTDQMDYLPDDILHKVDRAAMATGLETRIPMLDHRLIEFAWRLPASMLFAQGKGKQPLRRLLARHVPQDLFDRPKQGFAPPMASWLRGGLREWAESLLSVESLRELPMLDTAGVRALWKAHLEGRVHADLALWSVLMLADWRRRFAAAN